MQNCGVGGFEEVEIIWVHETQGLPGVSESSAREARKTATKKVKPIIC